MKRRSIIPLLMIAGVMVTGCVVNQQGVFPKLCWRWSQAGKVELEERASARDFDRTNHLNQAKP